MRYSMLCDICIFCKVCLLHTAKNSMSSILFWTQPVTIKQNSQETTWETNQTSDPSIREQTHTHLLSFLNVWSSTPSFCPIISKDIFNQTVFYICVRSQYFGSLMVIFCVELASGVWTYDEVRDAMNKQECLHSPLSHVSNMAASRPFPVAFEWGSDF